VIGILDYAAYVPIHRLSRAEIGRAWGRLVPPYTVGERAVSNFDEDSVTMGAEATLRCLAQSEGQRPDGLYFASTTAPDHERQAATSSPQPPICRARSARRTSRGRSGPGRQRSWRLSTRSRAARRGQSS